MAASIENVKKGLRTRQAVLRFLTEYITENGWAPSHNEIADAVGLKSSYGVRWHLDTLEFEGYIKRLPNVPRAMVVLDQTLVDDFLNEDLSNEALNEAVS